MEPPSYGECSDTSHVDWAYLPPPAMHVIGTLLPPASVLRARLVSRHWSSCLAAVVDTLYIVPEYFLTEPSAQDVPKAFPKAMTVNLDLQDTFMAVTWEVKDSLDRYAAERNGKQPDQAPASETGEPSTTRCSTCDVTPTSYLDLSLLPELKNVERPSAIPSAPEGEVGEQQPNPEPAAGAAASAPDVNPPPTAAAGPAITPPPPTFPHSAVSLEPLTNIVPPTTTHLRVRLPDSTDIISHNADMPTTWDYVSTLLTRVGPQLSGLSLSTAPDAGHISMLSPLTQLTSLTMDEASHSTWSTEHLPTVGSLTRLRNLAIKIPPFRSARPPEPTASVQPSALASWTALQELTKLHVSALRYSFHSSLVAVLPHLTKLEYLALRAPQTRLPWPTERPLFANIGTLTGLTQLSLALGDHNMSPTDWQSLTTLTRLSTLELSVAEGSDGLNVPVGLDFSALRCLKLRYPNSQDLVRISMWSGVQRLDIKFPEHERVWHQEDAMMELLDVRKRLQPTAGAAVIASVLDNSPMSQSANEKAIEPGTQGPANGTAGAVILPAPTGAGNTAGLTEWWSPLLPLLALPNMTDFRCSAKEGLASHDPILFDQIVSGLCAAWPGITRLCFKGYINVASQAAGWDSLRALTKLQQLELRHHPPTEGEQNSETVTRGRAPSRYLRVDPIKLPATSLPDSLQTLLLENVELRRKETDCLANLTSLERRTTCRHFPEFKGMPLQRLVVSNCCVKAKGIKSIAEECASLTHLVFAVYKVSQEADLLELQNALREMVRGLKYLQVLKVRVLAACITEALVEDMVTHLPHLQRLKLTSSDGWTDTALFLPLTRMTGLRKCSLAYFKLPEAARLLRAEFRTVLPYCKIKAKYEPH